MKPTSRKSIERRLEAMETAQAATEKTPELRLIINQPDGSQEVHVLGAGGKFILPVKMEPEQWAAKYKGGVS